MKLASAAKQHICAAYLAAGRVRGKLGALWQETDPEQATMDQAADQLPETDWKQVLEGQDEIGWIVLPPASSGGK